MDRLTLIVPNGDIWLLDATGTPCALISEDNDNYKYIKRLAEYEDLEEQGKLIKLPCKIGDKIFVIPSKANLGLNIVNGHEENNRIYEQIVNRIEIYKSGYLLSTCNGMSCVVEEFYKETWFLSKKEAQAALKAMSSEWQKVFMDGGNGADQRERLGK